MADSQAIFSALEQQLRREKLLYIEVRALSTLGNDTSLFHSQHSYWLHHLDLSPDLDTLFQNCHKDCTRRKIRRAEREGLRHEDGRSEPLLKIFYDLLLQTRRRHQIPPQPKQWFHNLMDCLGKALTIRVAFKDSVPVAAILTTQFKDVLLYKYGCSDTRFSNLGGMQFLLWKAIQEAKLDGMRLFDFGRSECDNAGLITFKDRLGSARSLLTYSRFTTSLQSGKNFTSDHEGWKGRVTRRMIAYLPDRVFSSVGGFLYKHIG
jgi:lipid II:glycine glycyltransferase (peptidoglycan interpeptide bridge formation enzyme)